MLMQREISPTMSDQVYHILKNAIVAGEFQWGEQLKEVQLSKQLNVSRSPVREALKRLNLDGLVINVPHKGVYVKQVTRSEIQDVMDLRYLFESRGICMSTENLTDDTRKVFSDIRAKMTETYLARDVKSYAQEDYRLHRQTMALCKNQYVDEMGERMYLFTQLLRISALKNEDRFEYSYKEHLQYIDSLLSGQLEEADEICRRHLEETKVELFRVIDHYQEASPWTE